MYKNLFIALCFLVAVVAAYKLGDKNGYEDGYQEGYTYDCREDIMALKRITGSLSKSVEFANKSVAVVKRENDSLKNYEEVKKENLKIDSLNKVDSVYHPRKDVDGQANAAELNKAIHKNGRITDDVLKGIAGVK